MITADLDPTANADMEPKYFIQRQAAHGTLSVLTSKVCCSATFQKLKLNLTLAGPCIIIKFQ